MTNFFFFLSLLINNRFENQPAVYSSSGNLVQKQFVDLKLNDQRSSRTNLKKNDSKSNKSLAKSLSRSNSKEQNGGVRSRTTSSSLHQSIQPVQGSPSNLRKFVRIFTASQMMGKPILYFFPIKIDHCLKMTRYGRFNRVICNYKLLVPWQRENVGSQRGRSLFFFLSFFSASILDLLRRL